MPCALTAGSAKAGLPTLHGRASRQVGIRGRRLTGAAARHGGSAERHNVMVEGAVPGTSQARGHLRAEGVPGPCVVDCALERRRLDAELNCIGAPLG